MDGTSWSDAGDLTWRTRATRTSAVKLATLLVCSLATTGASQETLAVDSAGRAAAGIVAGGALSDDQVRDLLRQYNVLPYAVHFSGPLGGFLDVPPEQATLELIAETRRRTVDDATRGMCRLVGQGRQTRQSEPRVRPAPGEHDLISRRALTELERARAMRAGVLRGELAIYSVVVIGRVEDVRRLSADPRIRDFRAGQLVRNGLRREFVVRDMWPPNLEPPGIPRITPEIDALSAEEVRARLDSLARQSAPECREVWRNSEMDEPAVRVKPVPGQAGTYAAAGLVFRAESQVVPASDHRPEPSDTRMPQAVKIVLTVSNPSEERLETGVRGCTVRFRAYRADERTRGAPVWDEGRGGQCMDPPTRLALGPRESRTIEQNADVWRIFGESLPAGRYAFAVLFRLADQTLEIPAGEVSLPDRLAGLTYRIELQLVGTELRAAATIVNTTSRPIYLEFGDCTLRLHAYRNPARSGTPVWRSDMRAPWQGYGGYDCLAYLRTATIAPRGTLQAREFQLRVPTIEILGDSLPNGKYYFAASLRLNFGRTPELPAGSVTLAVPREPLPPSRRAESVTYSAATDVVDSAASPTIRTVVTMMLPLNPVAVRRGSKNAALHRYSRNCPLVLHAYRDRARRNAAPQSGTADWTSARDCGAELQELVLQGDEPRTFEVRATAREILGDRLPPGRYYFVVTVHHERRTVYLSAGEANVAK